MAGLNTSPGPIGAPRPMVIGRDPSCDLHIDDPRVEGFHAELYPVGDLWWIRDLGSADGTYLNGDIVDAAPMEAPFEIRLGAEGPTLLLDPETEVSLPAA